jgi:hypothetical protein
MNSRTPKGFKGRDNSRKNRREGHRYEGDQRHSKGPAENRAAFK